MGRAATFDRTKVLDRAQSLFWRKGFLGTSLKDLETTLDMRPGSIYAAFGSKEELFAETLKLYAEQSTASFQRRLAEAGSPLAGLAEHVRAMGRVVPDAAPSQACMLVKTMLETPAENDALLKTTESFIQMMEAEFAAAFQLAIDCGELPKTEDAAFLASRLQTEIFGLKTYAQRAGSKERVRLLADSIARDLEARRVWPKPN